MNLVVMGPQGSGKGTQARLLLKKLGLVYLEMGEMFRQIAEKKTPFGKTIAGLIIKGTIIPDGITLRVVKPFLTKNLKRGIVFDGFPRRLSQARLLDKELAKRKGKIDMVIFLKLSQKESLKRLLGRRICPKCSRVYNLLTMPPKNDEICDDCHVNLVAREDETPEAITRRLANYQKETIPVIKYYKKKGIAIEIDGEQPVKDVFEDILKKLE